MSIASPAVRTWASRQISAVSPQHLLSLVQNREFVRTLALIALSSLFWVPALRFLDQGHPAVIAVSALLGALAIGLAFWRDRRVLSVLAYLVAAETMIRELTTSIGYMFVEYVCIAAALCVMLRCRGAFRWPVLLLSLYLVLELMGGLFSTAATGARAMTILTASRLALLVLAVRLGMDRPTTGAVLRGFVVGTSSLALTVMTFASNARWTGGASWEASAGMGPDQVAFVLVFGAFACLVLAEYSTISRVRIGFYALLVLHSTAVVMTVVRGAAITLAACIAIYVLVQAVRNRQSLWRVFMLLIVLCAGAWFAIDMTDSMLIRRFEKGGVSNRDTIARGGWEMFRDNPIFGIGTGNFRDESSRRGILRRGMETGSHNEIVRAIAEHGMVGGFVYLLFLIACLRRSVQGVAGNDRVVCLLFAMIAIVYETHSGMKIATQAILMAVACEAFRGAGAAVPVVGRLPRAYARQPMVSPVPNARPPGPGRVIAPDPGT